MDTDLDQNDGGEDDEDPDADKASDLHQDNQEPFDLHLDLDKVSDLQYHHTYQILTLLLEDPADLSEV